MSRLSDDEKRAYLKRANILPMVFIVLSVFYIFIGKNFDASVTFIVFVMLKFEINRNLKIIQEGIETKALVVKKSQFFKMTKLKVKLNVNNKEYYGLVKSRFDVLANFSENDEITVFYNEKNPKKIMTLEELVPNRFIQK